MNLTDRIAAALRDATAADEVERLLPEARQAATAADDEIAAARADSMSPLATAAVVAKARQTVADASFDRERLAVAITALVERVTHLRECERQDAAATERAAALLERDELAEVIAAEAPDLIRRFAALVRDIEASDARLNAIGLIHESAEVKARGYSSNGQWQNNAGQVVRLRDVKLPLFDRYGLAFSNDFGSARFVYPALEAGV